MRAVPLMILVAAGCAAAEDRPVLRVEDIVRSVTKHYPPLLAALAGVDIADGEVIAAEGKFDTTLRTRVDSDSFGYYANRRFDSSIEQPLSWQGASLFSGYRVGEGEFAPYDGKLQTRSLGEFRTGFRLPLLRDRSIDGRRGELEKARTGRALATLSVEQQKLAVLQSAISRYWSWTANARRLAITRDVLSIAEARQRLLEEAVTAGQTPRIDAIDNERAILQRRSALIEAERAFQQSSIELSLFYRDASGSPIMPELEQAPVEFPAAEMPQDWNVAGDLASALRRRPETGRLEAQARQNQVDADLARNAAKPAVDLFAGFFNEGGSAATVRRGPRELRAGISFDFPFQNRAARGKQRIAEAKGRQIELQAEFLKNQIAAEVQDAFSAIRAAYGRLAVLGEEVRVSRSLEEAERTRFEFGEGTLFVLNLREQATMDAALREAAAKADYHRARTAYEYATGELLRK